MADNIILPGTSEAVATDDIGGVQYQIVKPAFGALNTATLVSAADPMPVTVANTSFAVTGTFYQATQPVSGTVTVSNPTAQGLTDTQLRAAAVPVSLSSTTVTGSVAVTGPLTDTQLRLAPVPVSLTSTTVTGSVAVTGTFWQATQPISGTVTVNTISGFATEATLAARVPVNGQALMAASVPVTLASNQSALPVTGTFFQATQPVSIAAAPVTPVTDNAGSLTVDAPVATPVFVRLSDGAAAIATLPVSLATAPTTPVTGTFWQATQPVSLATLPVTNAGTFAVQAAATLAAETTKVIGTVNVAAAQTLATVSAVTAITNALPVGANVIGGVTQSGTWNIGSITTLPALVAGTAIVGKVGIDQTTPGTTNAVSVPDQSTSGSLGALNATLALAMSQCGSAAVEISGTWVGTITFEATIGGTVWTGINGTAASTSTPATTTTVNGLFRLSPAGVAQIRVNMSAYTSGTATIAIRSSVGTASIFANQILPVRIDQTTPGSTNQITVQPSTLAVTATAAANTAVTLTLPAVAGQFHYITGIEIMRTATAALTGTATLVVTTTNLPGSLAWSFGNAMVAGGTQRDTTREFNNPLKSSVVNTATTLVMPAPGAAVLWRANVYYYVAA